MHMSVSTIIFVILTISSFTYSSNLENDSLIGFESLDDFLNERVTNLDKSEFSNAKDGLFSLSSETKFLAEPAKKEGYIGLGHLMWETRAVATEMLETVDAEVLQKLRTHDFLIRNMAGIGVTDPEARLDILGTDGIEIMLRGDKNSNIVSPDANLYLLAGKNKEIHIGSHNTNSMLVLNEVGNVGIGTLTPTSKLHIVGDISAVNQTLKGDMKILGILAIDKIRSAATEMEVYSEGSMVLRSNSHLIAGTTTGNVVFIAGDGRAILTAGGDFGIGIMTPTAKLDVGGKLRAASALVDGQVYVKGEMTVETSMHASLIQAIDKKDLRIHGQQKLIISTKVGDVLVIDDTGFVGIGVSNPTAKLDVMGSIAATSCTIKENITIAGTAMVTNIKSTAGTGITVTADGLFTVRSASHMFFTTGPEGAIFIGGKGYLLVTSKGNVGVTEGHLSVKGGIQANSIAVTADAVVGNNLVTSSITTSDKQNLTITSNGNINIGVSTKKSLVKITEDGKIGINTATPRADFEVAGSIRVADSLVGGTSVIEGMIVASKIYSPVDDIFVLSGKDKIINFGSNDEKGKMVITATGFIGINETAPKATLHVGGGTYITGDSNFIGSIAIGTPNTPRAQLDVEGKIRATSALVDQDLGVGRALVVREFLGIGVLQSTARVSILSSTGDEINLSGKLDSNIFSEFSDLKIRSRKSKALHFGSNNVDSKVIIDIDGNVTIGSDTSENKLDVSGAFAAKSLTITQGANIGGGMTVDGSVSISGDLWVKQKNLSEAVETNGKEIRSIQKSNTVLREAIVSLTKENENLKDKVDQLMKQMEKIMSI